MIKRTPYGHYQSADVSLFVLENKFLKVSILDYGATITSIVYKPLKRETILGLKNFEDYLTQGFYLGALAGRVANRINQGKFTLNDHDYQLSMNGPHHLHGGLQGFDKRHFQSEILDDELILTLISNDGDQGYPGTLDLQIIYALEGASLLMKTSAICDQDTLFDTTQHTYFNLNPNQSEPILNHSLTLNSECLYEVEEDGCTGAHVLNIEKTPFDFRQPDFIQKAMDFNNVQINRVKGIDHYFMKKEFTDPVFCLLSVSDLSLKVSTTLPGAHIYTGNFLEPLKNGSSYPFLIQNGGLCFETQHVPNSINFDLKEAPILKADTLITSTTIYEYSSRETHENSIL